MVIRNQQPKPTPESIIPKPMRSKSTPFREELLDELLANYKRPEDLTGPDGVLKQLTKALVERAMNAEMTEHLGYEPGASPPEQQANRRNGSSGKTLRSDHGSFEVQLPRDRKGTFEPQLVGKHQRDFNGFDDKTLSVYARGMSTREIRAHLEELYGVDVSPDLISRVTDEVVAELKAWAAGCTPDRSSGILRGIDPPGERLESRLRSVLKKVGAAAHALS